MAQEEGGERARDATDQSRGDHAAEAGAEEVEGEDRPEGEGGGLDGHLDEPEPEKLERQRAEARHGVEGDPLAEGARLSLARPSSFRGGLFARCVPSSWGNAAASAWPPTARKDRTARCRWRPPRGLPEGQEPHEHPGSQEGAGAGPEHVDAVEHADRPSRGARGAHAAPHEEGQRHPHQDGGRQKGDHVQECPPHGIRVPGAEANVEDVVVEPSAQRSPGGDRDFQRGEGHEGALRRQAKAEAAAQMAADAQPRHERAHDHGDRFDSDAGVQGENALPGHLVDEGGSPAHEESRAQKRQMAPGEAGGSFVQGEHYRCRPAVADRGPGLS